MSLLPDPLPAEPLHGAQPAAEVPSTKKDASTREKSPPEGEGGDEAEEENAARRSSSETSSSSSDDDGDEDPEMPAHLICPQGRLSVPKVRAFADFAVPRLKKHFAQLKKSVSSR